MIEFMLQVVCIAVLSAAIILILKKWNVIEWLQANGPGLIGEMALCDFCLSFWTNQLLLVVYAVFTKDIMFVLFAIINAPITRKLL